MEATMKTYITKSKSGHYSVTIHAKGSIWPVYRQGKLPSLEAARNAAKAFLDTYNSIDYHFADKD